MDPSCDTAGARPEIGVVSAGLLAHAEVRLSVEAAGAMRRSPFAGAGEPFAVSALKHFDEQTLAVLTAVRQALGVAGLDLADARFRGWGVLAAPRYLGRSQMVPSMARFHAEGAWGVSPHMVPYRSLHSISGTVSQFLQCHGPNFGVGGGPAGVGELLLAGLSLLASVRPPGLWLVASRIEPDVGEGENGRPHLDSFCEAVALAIVPESAGAPYRLEFSPSMGSSAPVDLPALCRLLGGLDRQAAGSISVQRATPGNGPHFFPSAAASQASR